MEVRGKVGGPPERALFVSMHHCSALYKDSGAIKSMPALCSLFMGSSRTSVCAQLAVCSLELTGERRGSHTAGADVDRSALSRKILRSACLCYAAHLWAPPGFLSAPHWLCAALSCQERGGGPIQPRDRN